MDHGCQWPADMASEFPATANNGQDSARMACRESGRVEACLVLLHAAFGHSSYSCLQEALAVIMRLTSQCESMAIQIAIATDSIVSAASTAAAAAATVD